MAFFPFCCVLVLVDFWLCFWLLLVLASVFWPFSIKQRTSKVNECFSIFPYVPFILCISPQLLIYHIFQHVHEFHVMFLQFLWIISRTSCIWHHFTGRGKQFLYIQKDILQSSNTKGLNSEKIEDNFHSKSASIQKDDFFFSILFLDMFMPTFAEYSNMRASYIQLKGTAAKSTRA